MSTRRRYDIPITKQTEREMIETILSLYCKDEKRCREMAIHLAQKLRHRRSLLRNQGVIQLQPIRAVRKGNQP